MKYLIILSGLLLVCSCQDRPPESQPNFLGSLEHQFSISEAARPGFEKGLLLLHSFEYEDAREAFQQAIEADGDELMAYWGEAMTHYKALWGLQDVDAGRVVMQKLGASQEERLDRAENELERDFWFGVELLFGEGEFKERNQTYAQFMEELHAKYPDNQEVAAFYALGLMWSVPLGRVALVVL